PAALAPGWLHRVLCLLARRGYLGLHLGSFSERGAGKRTEPGQLLALVDECADLIHFSAHGGVFRGVSICFFLSHDGLAVLRGSFHLSGNQGRDLGTDAKKDGNRVNPFSVFFAGSLRKPPWSWTKIGRTLLAFVCDNVTYRDLLAVDNPYCLCLAAARARLSRRWTGLRIAPSAPRNCLSISGPAAVARWRPTSTSGGAAI